MPSPPLALRRTSLAAGVSLVERCRRQDRAAFRDFVREHERAVFALLGRMLAAADVEDAAQETFVRAFRAFPSFDPAGSAKVSTWLLVLATRAALDARRRARARVGSAGASDDDELAARPTERPSNPEIALARRQLGAALSTAAESLPDDQRAALLLVEVHGFSLAEVGEALGVPEATAKTKLFRAREKMRAALSDWREP